MKSPLDDLTASDIQIIKAFAISDMRISGAANKLGLNKTTVYRRLRYIYKRAKLDPCRFHDLVKLMRLIEGEDDV